MTSPRTTRRQFLSWGATLSAGFALAGCSSSNTSSPGSSSSGLESTSSSPDTFRFAQAATTFSLDVGQSFSIETSRISVQILDNLVTPHPDTSAPSAALAESWKTSEDGLSTTFQLRPNVTFHDGSALTPASIIANFERWKLLAAQGTLASVPYQSLVGNSMNGAPLLTSITANGNSLTFKTSRQSTMFLQALSQPAFGIVKEGSWDAQGYVNSPIGTGAYALTNWENGKASLRLNKSYWGSAPNVSQLEFTSILTADKRYYSLLNNEIDAYDQVDSDDFVPLAKTGIITQTRDPFAAVYLDLNLNHNVLKNIYIRRAIAHAIKRSDLTSNYFAQGSYSSVSYLPNSLQISGDKLNTYLEENTNIARELLRQSGYSNEPISFYYPTGVNLTAIPHPEAIYASVASALTAIGLVIKPVPVSFQDGYQAILEKAGKDRGISLVSFFGTYRDPYSFYEPLIGRIPPHYWTDPLTTPALEPNHQLPATTMLASSSPTPSPSATSNNKISLPDSDTKAPHTQAFAQLRDAIYNADKISAVDQARIQHEQVLLKFAELLPAIPLVFAVSAEAQNKKVTYLPLSITGVSAYNRLKMG